MVTTFDWGLKILFIILAALALFKVLKYLSNLIGYWISEGMLKRIKQEKLEGEKKHGKRSKKG